MTYSDNGDVCYIENHTTWRCKREIISNDDCILFIVGIGDSISEASKNIDRKIYMRRNIFEEEVK